MKTLNLCCQLNSLHLCINCDRFVCGTCFIKHANDCRDCFLCESNDCNGASGSATSEELARCDLRYELLI